MDSTSHQHSIQKQTMHGKKLFYDYLAYDYKASFTTIASIYSGKKYAQKEVQRVPQKLPDLEAQNYQNLKNQFPDFEGASVIDCQRIRQHFSQFYTLHKDILCSFENNKSLKNVLVNLRQMFNDQRFDASIVYYAGPANRQGNWVIESRESGDEEVPFKEIRELWNNRSSKQSHLALILDSNHSGKWIKELNALDPKIDSISIATACKDQEKAIESEIGGFYTHNLLKLLTKNSIENVIATPQTPQFGGDYLALKKFTNLFLKFNNWQELSEFQKSDFSLIDYENGTYLGHLLNGQKHFWGVFQWKKGVFEGCKYLGEFRGGKLNGKGILIYNNGRIYEGDFVNNTPDGKATETYPNKDKYVGQFSRGYKNGKGTYYYANGEVYEGKFVDNKPHGQGVLKMPNGSIYEGNFANGKCNGKGKFKYANGDVYEGDWQNSVKHGKGTYTYSNGSVYVGEFAYGLRHGFGKFSTPAGEVYEGNWEKDLKSGEGNFVANGQTFAGEWVRGQLAQTSKFFSKTGTQKIIF